MCYRFGERLFEAAQHRFAISVVEAYVGQCPHPGNEPSGIIWTAVGRPRAALCGLNRIGVGSARRRESVIEKILNHSGIPAQPFSADSHLGQVASCVLDR